MTESSKIKVAIWREFAPPATLIRHSEASVHEVLGPSAGLHEEIYVWRMGEDPFGGILDPGLRDSLKTQLTDTLSVSASPASRTIESLRAFVTEAEKALKSGRVEWSGSQSSSDDEDQRQINALLSLVIHLRWLVEVYEKQPNVSVTVQ